MIPRSPAAQRWLAPALLALAALAAYAGTFSVPFFFDDAKAIVENPSIRDLSRIGEVLFPPPSGNGSAGRPLVNLSLALNHALGGLDPRGYHALNLLLHVAAALAFFGLVRRTLLLPALAPRFGSSAFGLALTSALLWTLHPLQTESVTCVIQRTELLVSLFYLLTLYAFVRALDSTSPTRWLATSVAACALGMASKEVMVSAPLLVLLYDRAFAAGTFRAAWQRRSAYHLALAATWVVLLGLLFGMGGSRGNAAGLGLGVPWWAYLFRQCEAIPAYLGLSFWPHPLVLDYGTDIVLDPWRALPGGLFLLALFALTLAALRWRPRAGFLGLWFFAILAPSSSVIPLITQTMAEHRMHLPLAAVVVAATLAIHQLAGARLRLAAAALLLALGVTTAARNATYRTELSIWADTLAKRPDNPRALASYGVALSQAGHPAKALPLLERAQSIVPTDAATAVNLGTVNFELRRFPESADHFRRAISLDPRLPGAHSGLGAALFALGDIPGSLERCRAALALDPDHDAAHFNAARACFALGRFPEAIDHYQRALRRRPDSPDTHYNLGLALARAGEVRRALPHFDAALRLKPSPEAHLNYARFLASASLRPEALAALENALRLRPDFPEALAERARLRAAPP